MGERIEIKVTDDNHKVIRTFNSKADCAKYYSITRYKLDYYIANKILFNGNYFISDDIPKGYIKSTCSYCRKTFYCLEYRINRSENVYCSIECRDKALEGEPNCICPVCGKEFHIEPWRINRSKNNYCSIKCHAIATKDLMKGENNHQYGLKGDLNASWKSDEKISSYGYKLIRCLNHPFKNIDDFVFEHRLVAEKYLLNQNNSVEINGARYLKKEYVVHHINFNRLDNRPENLEVMLLDEHMELHKKLDTNFFEFEKYCNEKNIDFEDTYKNHLYNIERYKR